MNYERFLCSRKGQRSRKTRRKTGNYRPKGYRNLTAGRLMSGYKKKDSRRKAPRTRVKLEPRDIDTDLVDTDDEFAPVFSPSPNKI